MSTTTPEGGAAQAAQPTTPEAVTDGYNADQIITMDDNGTPTMEPVASPSESAEAAPETEAQAPVEVAQAPADEPQGEVEDLDKFARAKGFDPAKLSEGERKALEMARNAEKRMHEATSKSRELEQATAQATIDYTGDPNVDALAQTVNQIVIQNTVRDFFSNNPEARNFESKMAEIVMARPHLKNDLDALYALAKSDPNREAEIEANGGRKALENLAQKQQQIPPGANATNSSVYADSSTITPANVYDLVDSHDQAWFEKNHKAISEAMAGKQPS